jgi:hypothetical protein
MASSRTWTALFAADGQGLAQAFGGLGGPDRQEDDLAGDALLGELCRLLDGILVELGEASFDACPVDGEVRVRTSTWPWAPART